MTTAQINDRVVRSKGDYVVGDTGVVIAIDNDKNRAQVNWGWKKTWVSFNVIELESTPYTIYKTGKYPKYKAN